MTCREDIPLFPPRPFARALTSEARALLSALPVAAGIVDSLGRIVALNSAAENLLGWGESACVGQSLHALIDCTFPARASAPPCCPVAYVLRDNLPISTTQTLIRTRSGALHPVEYHCAPFAQSHDQRVIVTWRDVAQQRRLEEELQRLASIPEESPNPIVELDACATLVYANSIMMELIGQFGFDEAAFPAILPPQVVNIVQECLHSGSSRAGFLVTCSGHSYEWTFFPVPSTTLVRGYGVNLTERLRMENELRQAQRAAEAANQAKSEFLATISHELRTPLNGILGMSTLLTMTAQTPEQQEYTKLAHHSAQTLLSLVNDLLDFSKMEAGKLELEQINFSLSEVLDQTLALFLPQTNQKRLALRSEIASECCATFRGDPDRLRQILVNLIANAVKFTEKGEVVIEVRQSDGQTVRQSGGQTCLLHFSIRDTGIGIPEDRRDRLFKSFSQVDSSTTRKYGGTGLGLAISKQLVELMDGHIGVESIPGQGSTFWFTVPLELQCDQARVHLTPPLPPRLGVHPQSTVALVRSTDENSASSASRLLLVEDNQINQKLASRLLKKFGYEVDIAGNGQEALTILSRQAYTAILMDCQMPELDGFEATRIIRAQEIRKQTAGVAQHADPLTAPLDAPFSLHPSALAHTPIIALTANAVTGDRERCLAAGMDDYLTKPIDPTELKSVLARWLPHRSC